MSSSRRTSDATSGSHEVTLVPSAEEDTHSVEGHVEKQSSLSSHSAAMAEQCRHQDVLSNSRVMAPARHLDPDDDDASINEESSRRSGTLSVTENGVVGVAGVDRFTLPFDRAQFNATELLSKDASTADIVDESTFLGFLVNPDAPAQLLKKHRLWQTYCTGRVEDVFLVWFHDSTVNTPLLGAFIGSAILWRYYSDQENSREWLSVFLFGMVMLFYLSALVCGGAMVSYSSPANWGTAIRRARFYEGAGHVTVFLAAVYQLEFWEALHQCEINRMWERYTTQLYCRKDIYILGIAFKLLPVCYLAVRGPIAIPTVILGLVAMMAGAGFVAGEFRYAALDPALVFIAHAVLTAFVVIALLQTSAQQRAAFESWIVLERQTRTMLRQRAGLNNLLRDLLPPTVVEKLVAGQSASDLSPHCTIGVCKIHDFFCWTNTLLPEDIVNVIDALHTAFDRRVVLPDSKVWKSKSAGDSYIIVQGLLENEVPNPKAVVKFCQYQCSLVQRLRDIVRVDVVCGVHTGAVCGGIIGKESLWYEIFGEVIAIATALADGSPAGRVNVSRATEAVIQGGLEGYDRSDPLSASDIFAASDSDVQRPLAIPMEEEREFAEQRLTFIRSQLDVSATIDVETARAIISDRRQGHRPCLQHLRLDAWSDIRQELHQPAPVIESFIAEAANSTAVSLATVVLIVLTAAFEETLTTASAIVFSITVAVQLVWGFWARSTKSSSTVSRQTVAAVDFLCSFVVYVLPYTFGIYYLRPSIFNVRMSYNVMVVGVLVLWHLQRFPWLWATIVLYSVGVITSILWYGIDGRSDALANSAIVCGYMTLVFYMRQRHLRGEFETTVITSIIAEATKTEYELERTLLHTLLPESVVPLMQAKISGSRRHAVVNHRDLCAGVLRLGQLSLESVALQNALAAARQTHADIEAIILQYNHILQKIHSAGDEVLLAGPLVKRTPIALPLASRAITGSVIPGAQELPLAAEALLHIVEGLHLKMGTAFTCILHTDTAFSAIIGTHRPALGLLGPAFFTAHALANAAPKGASVGTSQFYALASTEGVHSNVAWAEEQRWRIRGVGVKFLRFFSFP